MSGIGGDTKFVLTEKLLLYALTLIVAMLSWFLVNINSKLDVLAIEQAKRSSSMELLASLSANLKSIEQNQYKVTLSEAWITELRGKVADLERYVYGNQKVERKVN